MIPPCVETTPWLEEVILYNVMWAVMDSLGTGRAFHFSALILACWKTGLQEEGLLLMILAATLNTLNLRKKLIIIVILAKRYYGVSIAFRAAVGSVH